jgi:alpha-1,6-mannosyltransferase
MVLSLQQIRSSGTRSLSSVAARPSDDHDDEKIADSSELSLVRPAIWGFLASTSVVIGSVTGRGAFSAASPGSWFFGTQSISPDGPIPSGHASILSLLLVFGGLIMLTRTWFVALRQVRTHRGVAVRRIVGLVAIWVLPFLIAPPLFSRDAYSYAGQGEMVSHHIDPYLYGPAVLGATPFGTTPDPFWDNTPSPYGPVFLSADGVITELSGHHLFSDLLLLRLLELGGLALAVLALPTIARSAGRDPASVVLLGVGSPLALTALVGGAHNDALMVGLLVAGVALYLRRHPILAIAVCALAAGVKAPAFLAVAFIGWNWAGQDASVRQRVGRTFVALLTGAGVLGAASELSGLGFGWLKTLTGSARVFTGVTPVDAATHVVVGLSHVVQLPLSQAGVWAVAQWLGLIAAALSCLWLLVQSPRIGFVRSLGFALLALALFGPVLWAWYVTWGLMLLAGVAEPRLRRLLVGLTVAEAFIGLSSVKSILLTVVRGGVLDVCLAIAAVVVLTTVSLARVLPERSTP